MGEVTKEMTKHDVRIRRGNVNVHRDQGIVERFNRSSSERLFSFQYSQEMNLKSGERSREWVSRLPEVISALNREKTRLTEKRPVDAIKEKTINAKSSTFYSRSVRKNEKRLDSSVEVYPSSQKGRVLIAEHLTVTERHSLLQSAYKPLHSTETALLKVKNDILMSMNQQHVTLLVLLDLSAAFDTIHHDKLIQRLESDCGVTGIALAWFRSYLSDRFQRVSVNGGLSKKFSLCQGVPQGSCLGPLLFTIYTRKLFDIVERHLPEVHCYADDTQLYVSFSPNQSAKADDAIKSMTDFISDVRSWMISDNLMLNDDKT